MRSIIRPVAGLSARDRRVLHRWVGGIAARVASKRPVLEIRGSSLVVERDARFAHDLALAAMAVLGHAFFYEVLTIGEPALARPTKLPESHAS